MSIKKFALSLNKWHYLILWGIVIWFHSLISSHAADKILGDSLLYVEPLFTLLLLILSAIKLVAYSEAHPIKLPKDEKSVLSGKEIICKSCGYVGAAKEVTPGHFLIEIVLWLCYLVPGLIYTIWRKHARYNACPVCGSKELVPATSPIGKEIARASKISQPQPDAKPDVINNLKDLESMWKAGTITEQEFAALKSQIIMRQ